MSAVEVLEAKLQRAAELPGTELVEALVAAESELRDAGDWARLVNVYRRTLISLRRDFPLKVAATLWIALGDIFRDQLGDHDRASEAYGHARARDPSRQELAERFASVGR